MKGWGRGDLKTAPGRKMFLFLVCACLSNKSPSQATLHKASCTDYPWLSKALLQLLVFSRQLLDFFISSSLLQRDSCCRKSYGKSLASFYSSKYSAEDRVGWDCNDSGYICYRPTVTSPLKPVIKRYYMLDLWF